MQSAGGFMTFGTRNYSPARERAGLQQANRTEPVHHPMVKTG
jgi:hypothetical protein